MRVWRAEGLGFRYPGGARPAVADVGLEVDRGEVVAVLGPNGSGKSTLLRLLVGARRPDAGRVELLGRPVEAWDARARARRVAVLPQHEEPAFPITVGELVAMGRYPHLGAWRRPGPADRAAVASALERFRVGALAGREFSTLSGGERQRARIARAIAQEPVALVLDEPTAALDLAHEMEIWNLLREEAARGRAVFLTTHDLDLAARYADRLVLLDRGRLAAAGRPADVLTARTVRDVYGWPVKIATHDEPGPGRGAPRVVPLAAEGRPPPADPVPPSTFVPDPSIREDP